MGEILHSNRPFSPTRSVHLQLHTFLTLALDVFGC